MKVELPFEYNKLYELWFNSEYIPFNQPTIEVIVKSVIIEYLLNGKGSTPINVVSLLNDVEWQWMTNRGSLSKRIGKWLKDQGISISTELSTAIGNTARKSLLKDQRYFFDFTDKVDWSAGDFGDHDSCFFSGPQARGSVLKRISQSDHKGAVRLFKQHSLAKGFAKPPANAYYLDEKKECFYLGISRAWMSIDEHGDSPIVTLFNGYGLTTNLIGSLVATFLGQTSRYLPIVRDGQTEGDLYINAGGVSIGDSSVLKKIKVYNISLDGAGTFSETLPSNKPKRPTAQPVVTFWYGSRIREARMAAQVGKEAYKVILNQLRAS